MSGAFNVDEAVDKWLTDTSSTDGTSTNDTPATEGEGDESDTPAQTTEDQASQSAKPNGEQAGDTTTPAKPADNKERPTQQTQGPKPGDLVVNGQVVAKAGAERRHYEAAQRATREVQTTRSELQRLNTELNAFREASSMSRELGLSPDESTVGLQLAASWKANPVGVIQYLVEQAKAAGHSIDGIGGAADVGAIKRILEAELAPFRQQAQQVQQTTEAQTAAKTQVDDFVSAYGEDALTNSEALSKLIDAAAQSGQHFTLEQAYSRFAHWCNTNGYDPKQPIDPQIAVTQQPAQQATPASPQRNAPRPNGRAVAAPNGVVPVDTAAGVTGDEGIRDLVRMSMREQGFNV